MTSNDAEEGSATGRPPIFVTRSSMPAFDDYVREIAPLWESRWLTNRGEKVRELETELNAFLTVANSVLFTNGHLALETLLQAMELRGEVITTPFTFASTTHAIVRSGLTPVFADIRADDCTIDPEQIEQLITPQTTAIVPVHVYGNLCAVDTIQDIADRHGLKVIYDAAHAFGVRRGPSGVAEFGDASMFSFHATKVFNSIEGGLAVVKDAALIERLQHLQNFGLTGKESVGYVGGNAKMNEFSAAMGLCNLRVIDDEIARRARAWDAYRDRLDDVPGLSFLNESNDDTTRNHAYLPIRVDASAFGADRDRVHDVLMEHGVISRKYFAPLVTDFECYRDRFNSAQTPVAKKTSAEVLTLPMYADLSEDDIDRVCDGIRTARTGA